MKVEFQHRPAVALALGLIVGLTTAQNPWHALFLIAFAIWIEDGRSRWAAVIAFAVGLSLSPAPVRPLMERQRFAGEVTVASVPRLYPGRAVCEVEDHGRRLALYTTLDRAPLLGDKLQVQGWVSPVSEFSEDFWLGRSVVGILRPDNTGLTFLARGGVVARLGSDWRSSFVQWSHVAYSPQEAAMADALCFNLDSFLDPVLKENLAKSGTLHIVSASGLHVMIVTGALLLLGSVMPIPRVALLVFAVVFLVLYATATGLRPPVVRSVFMATLFLFAYLCGRESDGLSALAISASAVLLVSPTWLFDVGFQLSYIAVGALILFVGHREPPATGVVKRIGFWTLETLRVSVIASIASAPLLLFHFGQASLVSVFANLLISAVLPAVVVGSMAAHLVAFALPALSLWFASSLLEPLLRWIIFVGSEGGSLSFSTVQSPSFSGYWLVAFYGLALLGWRPHARPA